METSAANDTPTTSCGSLTWWLVGEGVLELLEAQVWQESDTQVMAVLWREVKLALEGDKKSIKNVHGTTINSVGTTVVADVVRLTIDRNQSDVQIVLYVFDGRWSFQVGADAA